MSNEDGRAGRSAAWGVAAALFGTGAFAIWQVAVAPKSSFPIWPTYVCAGVAALTLYMCFATVWGWWPSGRSIRSTSATVADVTSYPTTSTVPVGSATAAPASLPLPPVGIRLIPELDTATNRFLLGALNRGELGRFRIEVIDAHNQDSNWVGPRSWPVPWLDDGSVDAKEIPKFGKPLLDFAHFDFLGLQEDLDGTKWLNGNHWAFPSLPQPIKVRYSAVRRWSELENQHFVITVRVIRDDPTGYIDVQFKIGNDGTQPYCRELPERSESAALLSVDLQQLRDLAVEGRLKQPSAN